MNVSRLMGRNSKRRVGRIGLLALITALACAWASFPAPAAWAEPAPPVITTPTPRPTATSPALSWREKLLLTPEAQRRGQIVFLPWVVKENSRRALEAPPESFAYVVKPGDTLWTLALDFGRDLDTMSCATTPLGADVEALTPGQEITVPALKDLCHTVTPGDTLQNIAYAHGLTVADIVAVPWNGFLLPPYTVRPRQRVLLPGARPEAKPRPDHRQVSIMSDDWANTLYRDWPYGDGHFIWPVTGPISQAAHDGHWALDIAVPEGTPIQAADRGTVVLAGWSPVGYGFRVVIDHGNDYVTLYAHLRDIYVEKGQVVGKGQTIGVSGSNGNITGPHLHFELRDFGVLTDPQTLLPR
jgi:murein DD-endopeptidase MepM/ murein hydrolase activator NlpD